MNRTEQKAGFVSREFPNGYPSQLSSSYVNEEMFKTIINNVNAIIFDTYAQRQISLQMCGYVAAFFAFMALIATGFSGAWIAFVLVLLGFPALLWWMKWFNEQGRNLVQNDVDEYISELNDTFKKNEGGMWITYIEEAEPTGKWYDPVQISRHLEFRDTGKKAPKKITVYVDADGNQVDGPTYKV